MNVAQFKTAIEIALGVALQTDPAPAGSTHSQIRQHELERAYTFALCLTAGLKDFAPELAEKVAQISNSGRWLTDFPDA